MLQCLYARKICLTAQWQPERGYADSEFADSAMLELDPRRRATIEDMMKDPWVTQTPVCTQIEGGEVIKADGHEHTLERSAAAPAAPT